MCMLDVIFVEFVATHVNNYNWGCVGRSNYTTMLLQCMYTCSTAIKKEQKHVFIKRFLKRNLTDVGMAQWMHWLTKYTNKKCHPHSDMYSIITMVTLLCAWHFLFVYFVSQCIHWAIPTSARFLFRNLFIKTYIQISIRFHMILVCRKLDLVIFLSNNITSILLLDCYITSFAVLYWPSCGLQVCTVSYMGRYK